MMDPVELLAREDKWYLGSGDGIIFAPPFPVWLDAPGFWDEATIYQYQVGPLFTVTWLDADGRELPLRATSRRWTPADLVVEYQMPNGMSARETRTVQPKGIFGSEWVIQSPSPVTLHAVAWTVQDTKSVDLRQTAWDGALCFTRRVEDRRSVPLDVRLDLVVIGETTSWSATLSERSALQPHWRFAPFGEQWTGDRLPCRVRLEGLSTDGYVYGAVHAKVASGKREASVSFAMRVAPADAALTGRRNHTPLGMAVVRSARSETPIGLSAVHGGRPVAAQPLARASRRRWREFFASVPHFTCSDPYLERYYWYRWYGLFLNSVRGGVGQYRWPTVCEGIGFFHMPITYSAQCHLRELRWMRAG